MNPSAHTQCATQEREYATFYLGSMLCGIDIQIIREINRQVEITPVPHAPRWVRGVINLRGEVVTVLELTGILLQREAQQSTDSRNVIVRSRDESIGLLVDRVGDIVRVSADALEHTPPNVEGIDSRFFLGVCAVGEDLIVVLDIAAITEIESAKV